MIGIGVMILEFGVEILLFRVGILGILAREVFFSVILVNFGILCQFILDCFIEFVLIFIVIVILITLIVKLAYLRIIFVNEEVLVRIVDL